jgi:hypothetical protein
MNGRELRGWPGLSSRQNESGVRYIQQGISASKDQSSIVLRLIPLAFGKLGPSQRVLPLRVHINKEKWFTSATDSMHERGSLHFLVDSRKWVPSQVFLGTGQGQFA